MAWVNEPVDVTRRPSLTVVDVTGGTTQNVVFGGSDAGADLLSRGPSRVRIERPSRPDHAMPAGFGQGDGLLVTEPAPRSPL